MIDRDAHIKEKLQELVAAKDGASLKHISEKVLGMSHAYLQQYIKNGSPKRLDDDMVAKIAAYFDVPPATLDPTLGERSSRAKGSAVDVRILAMAIVATRSNIDTRHMVVDAEGEAEMIANAYDKLAAFSRGEL